MGDRFGAALLWVVLVVLPAAAWAQTPQYNRRIEDLSVQPSPTGVSGTYDVSGQLVFEVHAPSAVPLDLGMDTAPANDSDGCCLEACCCPSCSTDCGGGGCSGGTTDPGFGIAAPGIADLDVVLTGSFCDAIPPPVSCGELQGDGFTVPMTCDLAAPICRTDPFTITWTGVELVPGGQTTLILRARSGALPEIDTSDDVFSAAVPAAVPATPIWALVVLAMLGLSVAAAAYANRPA